MVVDEGRRINNALDGESGKAQVIGKENVSTKRNRRNKDKIGYRPEAKHSDKQAKQLINTGERNRCLDSVLYSQLIHVQLCPHIVNTRRRFPLYHV